jgi:hypothetical protein
MTISTTDLPSAVRAPSPRLTPQNRRRDHRRMARREVLRLIGGASLATGLAFIGLMPTARVANAHHTTYTFWPKGGYCTGQVGGSTGCSTCCSLVSSTYCAGNGWHRHDQVSLGGGFWREYDIRPTSCNSRNAWHWQKNGVWWRCSDGRYKTCDSFGCSGWTNTVCPKQV